MVERLVHACILKNALFSWVFCNNPPILTPILLQKIVATDLAGMLFRRYTPVNSPLLSQRLTHASSRTHDLDSRSASMDQNVLRPPLLRLRSPTRHVGDERGQPGSGEPVVAG